MVFTAEENSVLSLINQTVQTLSLVGSVSVVITLLCLRGLREFLSFRLILMLGLSDVFYGLGSVVGSVHDGPLCYYQAVSRVLFGLTSLYWSTSLAVTLHLVVLREKSHLEWRMWPYHLVCWSLPIILTLVPIFTDELGDIGPYCWIKPTGRLSRLLFYSNVWVAFLYNLIIHYRIQKTHSTLETTTNENTRNVYVQAHWYPVVVAVCYFVPSVYRGIEAFQDDFSVAWLYGIGILLNGLRPLCNSLIFWTTPGVRDRMSDRMRACCPLVFNKWCKYQSDLIMTTV